MRTSRRFNPGLDDLEHRAALSGIMVPASAVVVKLDDDPGSGDPLPEPEPPPPPYPGPDPPLGWPPIPPSGPVGPG